MRSTGAVITEIVEAYNGRFGQWVPISEIAQPASLTKEELAEAIAELIEEDDFRAEPAAFRHRVTPEDEDLAPVIGGEARHLIRWS